MGQRVDSFYGQQWCLLKLTSAMQTPRALFGDKIKRRPKLQSLPFPEVPLAWHQTGGVGRNLVAFAPQTNTASYSHEALKHKAIPASPWDLALGMVQHCPALISVACWWLTLKAAEPQENHSPGYLSIRDSATVTTKLSPLWVLLDAAGGSEKPSLACRWTVTKFSCWAEHSPPDY